MGQAGIARLQAILRVQVGLCGRRCAQRPPTIKRLSRQIHRAMIDQIIANERPRIARRVGCEAHAAHRQNPARAIRGVVAAVGHQLNNLGTGCEQNFPFCSSTTAVIEPVTSADGSTRLPREPAAAVAASDAETLVSGVKRRFGSPSGDLRGLTP